MKRIIQVVSTENPHCTECYSRLRNGGLGGEKREGSREVIKKLMYEGNRDKVSVSGIYMKNEEVMVER